MRAGPVIALAVLVLAAPAQAAVPGVNVSYVDEAGNPYVRTPADAWRAWRDIKASRARTLRTFVSWTLPTGTGKWERFVAKARARRLRVLLTVTGDYSTMATPAAYAARAGQLAAALRGKVAAYEVWNEEDDPAFWAGGPQPAAYTALLKAAYRAIKRSDPRAKVLVGGLVANDFDFVSALYDSGAKGFFDGVGVHTDTACLTAGPRFYYREPSGRIGRFSFTGYREVRQTMLARGDDKPVWMTELGWSTTRARCARGGRAGTKRGGVTPARQARLLTRAYRCLAADRYVVQAAWFNLHDLDTRSQGDAQRLGLITDSFHRKPAFKAFRRARRARPVRCGGRLDTRAPTVRFRAPAPGHRFHADLPVSIVAHDDQGVTKIQFYADGERIHYRSRRHGSGATLALDWQGAKRLARGPHTLTAKAYDEAHNVGAVTVNVTKIRGR